MAAPSAGFVDFVVADGCYAALTDRPLDPDSLLDRVRSPKAGANVLFAGSTRDNFDGRPVGHLQYAAYRPRALHTLRNIAVDVCRTHGLIAVAVVHRLGPVPVGTDSILIAASAPHRTSAWRGAEDCLEQVKARVEIWKQEVFLPEGGEGAEGGEGKGEGERVWRANAEAAEPPRPKGA